MSSAESNEGLYRLLARAGKARAFNAGEVVFTKGDEGDVMFILERGAVALKDGDRVVEAVGAPGLFGEMALIESKPRSLSAVAETATELVEITAPSFWVLVHETPYFAKLVMTVMAERLRRADEQMG